LDIIWGPELTCEEHYVTSDELNAIAHNPEISICDTPKIIIIKSEEKVDSEAKS
jgi:hypothetical protein